MTIRNTNHQKSILETILDGAMRGRWYDIDELLENFTWKMSKQALQCSIRILEKDGLVQREYKTRREKRRMIPTLTSKAYSTHFGVSISPTVSF